MNNSIEKVLNGWLVLDKPVGISSTKALGSVKKILGIKKAGHCGTLDPLASGVLPIAIGEATKVSGHILNTKKSYVFEIGWGVETTTGDLEGEIINTSSNFPEEVEVIASIIHFLGKSFQTPPSFSAIKVNGKPSYKLARSGEYLKLKPREVFIESFKLIKYAKKSSKFEIICSKGTYIRSIAVDLAKLLNTYGHITSLRRNFAGPFHINQSFSLDSLRELSHSGDKTDAILPIRSGLDDILAVNVDSEIAKKLRFGQKVLINAPKNESKVLIVNGENPVAIAEILGGFINPKRVFNFY